MWKRKALEKNALELEKEGKKEEAFYYYTRILKINDSSFSANKKLGFILSESIDSLQVAISYLEKARHENSDDKEILAKLFDLYLILGETEKVKKMLYDARKSLSQDEATMITELMDCISEPGSKNAKQMKVFMEEKENLYFKIFPRPYLLCLQSQNLSDKALSLAKKRKEGK